MTDHPDPLAARSSSAPPAEGEPRPPRVSVVLATFNRRPILLRLLRQLGEQTFPLRDLEVIVVDDGSSEPVAPHLAALATAYRLRVITQQNAGPARARHHGIQEARGEILVILDDDMQLPPQFLDEHVKLHPPGVPTAVFGRYRSDPNIEAMPLFERWYAKKWEDWSADYARGAQPNGGALCTGNVSMRRQDYLTVGGFDLTLDRSEDAELGLKLEQLGVKLVYSEAAYTLHGSDHTSVEKWIRRAYRYGICDLRIARKHPALAHADPWRYWDLLPRASRPLLSLAVAAPQVSRHVALAAMHTAMKMDGLGARRLAMKICGTVFGMEYFRGMRDESGGVLGAWRSRAEFMAKAAAQGAQNVPRRRALLYKAWADLQADHGWYEDRYSYKPPSERSFPRDLVEKIGLQIAAACRLMRFFRDAGQPGLAKLTSRMIRHVYGSDIHWDATIDPAVMFIHGMGLAINGAARVGPRCVIAQNVTLGMGLDPVTRQAGAPTLEANVRVGSGATLLGPITVGEGSKIMPGVVLTQSVPKNSLVEAAPPTVRTRPSKAVRDDPGEDEPR